MIVKLELPKNWPGDALFKLGQSKFWERQFFLIVTFKLIFDILLLITFFYIRFVEQLNDLPKMSLQCTL